MPRRPTLRSLFAALTMAALALCGGGKVQASERGTASSAEIRTGAATRGEARRGCTGLNGALPAEIIEFRDEAHSLDRAGAGDTADVPRVAEPSLPVATVIVTLVPPTARVCDDYPQARPRAPPMRSISAPTA
jgi:hypothetical protein